MARADKNARAGKPANGLHRSLTVDREKINREQRTVELSFSSEEPVERWGENEILSHDKGAYDFDRVNSGNHPFLLGHNEYDPDSQIGVIEKAWVDGGKGRAVVRLGNSAKAEEIFQDICDGIRKNISVGYDRTGIIRSDKAKDGRVTTWYKWMPTHIASVPVPADTSVGVGRSRSKMVKRRCADCEGTGRCRCRDNDDDEPDDECPDCGGSGDCSDCDGTGYIQTAKNKGQVDSLRETNSEAIVANLTDEQKTKMRILLSPTAVEGSPAVKEPTREEMRTAETSRIRQITALANEYSADHGALDNGAMRQSIAELATEAMNSDCTVDNFKIRIWEKVHKAKPAKTIGSDDVMDEKDKRNYSLHAGINSIVRQAQSHSGVSLPAEKTLEREVHDNMAKLLRDEGTSGVDYGGFLVPFDVPVSNRAISRRALRAMGRNLGGTRASMRRDMQVDIFGQGGAFVPTLMQMPIIELLRNMQALDKLGHRTLGGLTGNVVIPRQTAPSTAYVVSEIGALTSSAQTLDQIQLTPHRVGVTQNYSKQLVIQSTPDVEAFLRDDLFSVLALKWDYLGLNGQGANSEPLGILNTPGVGAITFGGSATYTNVILMETTVRNQNVLGEVGYLSTTAVRGRWKGIAEALTGATTIGGRQNALWQGDWENGTVNYSHAVASNQVPNNQVILGEYDQLIHALWGGLDVVVDPYTLAKNGEMVITINTWGDYALRHPQAFCISTDSGAQ